MIIELLNGTRYDIANYSLKRLFHRIPSAEIFHSLSPVEGRSDIITSSKFNNRIISVELLYESYDIYDYYLLRDELNALFARTEPFYIIFKREPYKRWKVRLSNQFNIEPHPRMQSFNVEFLTDNVCAESVATTADLKEWDVDKWGWNGTISWDEDLQYNFASNNFVVKNLGNAAIDPRQNELEIVIKATASSYLQITNTTTGEVFQFNGPLTANDTLILRGIRSLKNDVSVFRNTNHKVLTLAPGPNDFQITGGTLTSITFNFRFLYK